ncbi:MAG: hypothetical protein J6J60_05700 [Clostridia bacterium]|nr:hypothetical protein [Clostridia bacterium]MBP3596872.1 hypothetical protein [Clostridia bacterium]
MQIPDYIPYSHNFLIESSVLLCLFLTFLANLLMPLNIFYTDK